jgi:hypothetical protein
VLEALSRTTYVVEAVCGLPLIVVASIVIVRVVLAVEVTTAGAFGVAARVYIAEEVT